MFALISAWPERTLAAKAVLPSGPVLCHFLFFLIHLLIGGALNTPSFMKAFQPSFEAPRAKLARKRGPLGMVQKGAKSGFCLISPLGIEDNDLFLTKVLDKPDLRSEVKSESKSKSRSKCRDHNDYLGSLYLS